MNGNFNLLEMFYDDITRIRKKDLVEQNGENEILY